MKKILLLVLLSCFLLVPCVSTAVTAAVLSTLKYQLLKHLQYCYTVERGDGSYDSTNLFLHIRQLL
jgi:hypothetical protein